MNVRADISSITVGDFSQLTLKKIDVGLISEPHLDGDEVMATPLDFLERRIL